MEVSAKADEIISQASNWTFAGDCSLLDWMEEIGKNLEERAKATNKKFDQLSSYVKRTSVALDNANNSLTALQYTQFIENRCHDDDETIANASDVPVEKVKTIQEEEEDDSECDWKAMIKKNLDIFHKFHEKYSIDMEDSDDEDAEDNVVYQLKNPYNDRPLPHIYGTKEWKENWHVGLLDDNDEFSGDDVSEVFSETSSSAEDRGSFESTADNLSESASSTSIAKEKRKPQLKVQNASSLKGSQLFPEDKYSGTAAGSDSGSSASKTISQPVTNVEQYREQPHYDLFAPIQDTPPTSSSSSASLHHQLSSSVQSYKKSVDSDHTEKIDNSNSFLGENPEQPTPSVKSNPSQLRRRPVNLFDDDDFNSFMTEIVDKANNKQDAPVPTARKLSASSSGSKSIEQKIKAAGNLFDSRSNNPTMPKLPPAQESSSNAIVKETPKKKTLNLFDSPDSPPDDDIFSKKPIVTDSKKINSALPKLSSKNLFDDDDDDEDFLNYFASKKPSIPKIINKGPLFEDETITEEPKARNDLFGEPDQPNVARKEFQKPASNDLVGETDPNIVTPEETKKTTGNSRKLDLFSDIDDYDLFKPKAQPLPLPVEKDSIRSALVNKNKLKLFDDDDDDEDDNDDLFPKISRVSTEPLPKKVDLFSDEKDNYMKPIDIEKTPIVLQEPPKAEKTITPDAVASITHPSKRTTEDKVVPKDTITNLFQNDDDDVVEDIKKHSMAPEKEQIEQKKQNINKSFPKNLQESKENLAVPENMDSGTKADSINVASNTQDPTKGFFAESPIEDTSAEDNFEENSTEETETASFITEITTKNPIPAGQNPVPNAYTGLFLDEPPEDDDAFFQTLDSNALANSKLSTELEPDFYEPPLPKVPTDVVSPSTVSSANTYSSFGLFSEVPPDDDLDELASPSSSNNSTSGPKRIHSIFYDDFSETMEAVSKKPAESIPNVHSIFDDEPPPDDDFESLLNAQLSKKPSHQQPVVKSPTSVGSKYQEVPSKDVNDYAKVSGKTTDIKKVSEDLMEPKPVAAKSNTNISKLQMPKININVQALLPGAGQKPSFRKSLEDQKIIENMPEDNMVEDNEDKSEPQITASPSTNNENILVNVCKNRVRAPAKRRPSTRRGRQENYRKSLIAEQEDIEGAEETSETPNRDYDETRPLSQVNIVDSKLSSPEANLFSQTTDSPASSSPTKSLSKVDEINTANNNPKKSTANIFGDDTEDDLFANTISKSSNSSTTAKTKIIPKVTGGLFDDDDNDDDFLFLKKETPKSEEVPRASPIPEALTVEPIANTTESARKSQEDPLFGSVSKSKPTASEIPEAPPQISKVSEPVRKTPDVGLFSDDDYLFEKVANEQTVNPQFKKSIIKEPAKTLLFGDDSESDSDDLFGPKSVDKVKSKTPSTSNDNNPRREAGAALSKPTSIFDESDEEADEDDFLKALKKGPVNLKTKAIPSSESKGLFSDSDDDDDDLFTTKITRAPKTVNTTHNSSTNTGAVKSSTPPRIIKSTVDNPLADLLND